jgi:MFS family permease
MTPATAGSHRLAVWCAASAAFLSGLDGSVVAVSLPAMSQGFGSDMGTATWVTAGYMVALSCALLPSGRLLDRFGPWRFFSWGFMAFVLTSAGCAVSNSMLILILLRCLQGLSAGMLVVSAFAVIPRTVPKAEQAGAFATLSVLASLGVSLGGPLGGFLSQYASWRWVFLMNLPVGLMAAWQAHRFAVSAREDVNRAIRPMELITVSAGMLMLGAALIGLNRGDEWGWTSPIVIGAGICSILAGMLFLKRDRATRDPLVAWDAISSPVIRRGFGLAALAYLYLSGLQLLFPFDLVGHRHFSSSEVGGAMLAYSLPLMGAGAVSGKLSGRIGLQRCQAVAMVLVVAGSLVLALASGYLLLMGMAGCGAGFGLFSSPNNAAVMGAAPAGDQGRVAGSFQTVVRVSIAAGAVLFEALHNQFERLYRSDQCDADMAEGLAFRTSYLTGAALCLLVALLALYRGPGKATTLAGGR